MTHGYVSDKEALVKRLHRIEGQVRGIERMVDEERYCVEIVTQISAVQAALEQVGLKLVFADSGKAAVTLPVTADSLSGEGTVHRGAITALVEAAAGATLPEAEEQEAAALSDIKISFVRPAPQHPLVAEARTLACHGSLRSCEVDVHDWNGELVAKGFLTYSG